jgi:hypothetical protein
LHFYSTTVRKDIIFIPPIFTRRHQNYNSASETHHFLHSIFQASLYLYSHINYTDMQVHMEVQTNISS